MFRWLRDWFNPPLRAWVVELCVGTQFQPIEEGSGMMVMKAVKWIKVLSHRKPRGVSIVSVMGPLRSEIDADELVLEIMKGSAGGCYGDND